MPDMQRTSVCRICVTLNNADHSAERQTGRQAVRQAEPPVEPPDKDTEDTKVMFG